MARSFDSVIIGKGPDYAMWHGAVALFHVLSFVVRRLGSGAVNLLSSGMSSDRSLSAAVEGLKQKIAPYGWTANTEIKWNRDAVLSGIFGITGGEVVIIYRFHERLALDQKLELSRITG